MTAAGTKGEQVTTYPSPLGWAEPDRGEFPMSDQEATEEEARRDSERLEQVRAWGDRQEKRAKDLEAQLNEQRRINRSSAIRNAGADPDSYLGQVVMAAVERDDISDHTAIADLVRVIQAEARGA